MPEFAFDFADEDVDRHAGLVDCLKRVLPLPDASFDEYSKELVIIAREAGSAARRAHALVRSATTGTDFYIQPEGRGWAVEAPSAGADDELLRRPSRGP